MIWGKQKGIKLSMVDLANWRQKEPRYEISFVFTQLTGCPNEIKCTGCTTQ